MASVPAKPAAAFRMFCFPSAAGGASMFRPLVQQAPASLDVRPVQLPGRENRLAEKPYDRLTPLVEAATEALLPFLDIPYALFGHSMGAMLAFEATRRLEALGCPPVHLFVSGLRAPQLPDLEPPIYLLPDDEFLDELRRLNGIPDEVLAHSEFLRLLLPLMRADLTVCDTYVYQPQPPLSCPISVFGGLEDPKADRDQLEGWREQTTAGFRVRMLPGDHFYLVNEWPRISDAVARDLGLSAW
jgi:medium-chain acyl-[acyl-carrier-protein] hydrolase